MGKASTEAKKRYNSKTYDRISVSFRKDVATEYKALCDEIGISYSQVMHDAVMDFIEKQKRLKHPTRN